MRQADQRPVNLRGAHQLGFVASGGHLQTLQRNTSIVLHPVVDSFGKLFDIFGLLESGDGEDIAVVLLQIGLQLVGEF